MKRKIAFSILVFFIFLANLNAAQTQKKDDGKSEVLLNIGLGPAANMFSGPIADEQLFHWGLKLDLKAVLEKKTIMENLSKVPKSYRKYAKKLDEFSVSKFYIPDMLYISPKIEGTNHTGIYGINFRPLSLGLNLIKTGNLNLTLGIGLDLTYMFIHSDKLFIGDDHSFMHFIRPGADIQAGITYKFSRYFLMSAGWQSYFYLPQKVDGDTDKILEWGALDSSIWHNGQIFLLFHFRIPVRVKI